MSDERWTSWFRNQRDRLVADPDAGFVVLIYASVVLERAARIQLALSPTEQVGSQRAFFELLKRVVPDLAQGDSAMPENFWSLVRNGMAHDLAASKDSAYGISLSLLAINHHLGNVASYDANTLHVCPAKYFDAVLKFVEDEITVQKFIEGKPEAGVLALPSVAQAAAGTAAVSFKHDITESVRR